MDIGYRILDIHTYEDIQYENVNWNCFFHIFFIAALSAYVFNYFLIIIEYLNNSWKGMRNDVSTFIERCPCCQKMRRLKPLVHTVPFTLASYQPMKRICVDAIGPININGQKYVRTSLPQQKKKRVVQ